ncbi:MAG TPA: hypothetical protein VIH75_19860 [Candidatus Sulfotelmatobacter sp.]|jgi:hypothetical protein
MRFDSLTNILRSFLRHCGDIDLHHITVQQVTAFLDGSGVMPSTWSGKRGTLRTFFDHWTARGRLKSPPLYSIPPRASKVLQYYSKAAGHENERLSAELTAAANLEFHPSRKCRMSGVRFSNLVR